MSTQKNRGLFAITILSLMVLLAACSQPAAEESAYSPASDLTETVSAQTEPGIPPTGSLCNPLVTPGVTTRSELIGLLGEPMAVTTSMEGETLTVPSAVEEIPDTYIISEGVVTVISQLTRNDQVTVDSLRIAYGEPELITYSYFSQGTATYLYPSNGFTAIVEPQQGFVFFLECFVPESLESYMSGRGNSLPQENPYLR